MDLDSEVALSPEKSFKGGGESQILYQPGLKLEVASFYTGIVLEGFLEEGEVVPDRERGGEGIKDNTCPLERIR